MKSVDVIVVTYESSAQIGGAIACVAASDEVRRVIVVDNDSRDESAAAARRAGADIVRVNDGNVGFARAVNIGLLEADADFVLLLNPDARLTPPALGHLCATLKSQAGAAIAGPLLRRGGRVTAGAGRSATVARRVGLCLPLLGRAPLFRPEYAPPADRSAAGPAFDVDYVFGAALLIDRAFFVTEGGLDERFFLFAEDEDICRRARAAGRRVLLDHGAVADHVGGASCADRAATEAQRLFSTYRLFEKWDGPRSAAVYHLGIAAAFALRRAAARAERRADAQSELARTARLFTAAVRSGHDPLEPGGPELEHGASDA